MFRTRYPVVHILQLAAKGVSDDNGRASGVFHRNFSQTSRQRTAVSIEIGELRIELYAGADAETIWSIIQTLKEY